eukprot:14869525-Alexandrium_andersonii.AAC.1
MSDRSFVEGSCAQSSSVPPCPVLDGRLIPPLEGRCSRELEQDHHERAQLGPPSPAAPGLAMLRHRR